jgi:hypothetical protein
MGLLDDLRRRGASTRITEEVLYAEAIREVEDGVRRDGLWAKALAQSNMQEQPAQAAYLKLRVQSLRDEVELFTQGAQRAARQKRDGETQLSTAQRQEVRIPVDATRDRPAKGLRDWLNVLVGAVAVMALLVIVATIFEKFK